MRSALLLVLTLGSLALGSCYKPSFEVAIYKCDGLACPQGLVCNSDGFCVNHPVDGCTNGGISVDGTIYLCPGLTNRCQKTFQVCTSVPAELACQPPGVVRGDLGVQPACYPCCPK